MDWTTIGVLAFIGFIILLIFSLASIGSYWSRLEEQQEAVHVAEDGLANEADYSDFAETL